LRFKTLIFMQHTSFSRYYPDSTNLRKQPRSPDIAFGSSGERTEDYILHSTPRLMATS
jgi:hypothetical protein